MAVSARVTVSVVVVTFESGGVITECLKALGDLDEGLDVIVVDNASRDGTRDIVQASFPRVRLIELSGNQGFGRAVNVGARIARGDVLLIMNPDVRLEELDLSRLAREIAAPDAGVLVPRVHEGNRGREDYQFRQDRHWAWDILDHVVGPFRPRRSMFLSVRSEPRDWVAGAAFLMRRQLFLSLGGFDPRYFLYFEDRELCRRCRLAGYRLRPATGVRASHVSGASSPQDGRGERMTWSVLAVLQYVCQVYGDRAGVVAAALALIGFRVTAAAASWLRLAASRSALAARKRSELSGRYQLLQQWLATPEMARPADGFYPDAARVLERVQSWT